MRQTHICSVLQRTNENFQMHLQDQKQRPKGAKVSLKESEGALECRGCRILKQSVCEVRHLDGSLDAAPYLDTEVTDVFGSLISPGSTSLRMIIEVLEAESNYK